MEHQSTATRLTLDSNVKRVAAAVVDVVALAHKVDGLPDAHISNFSPKEVISVTRGTKDVNYRLKKSFYSFSPTEILKQVQEIAFGLLLRRMTSVKI